MKKVCFFFSRITSIFPSHHRHLLLKNREYIVQQTKIAWRKTGKLSPSVKQKKLFLIILLPVVFFLSNSERNGMHERERRKSCIIFDKYPFVVDVSSMLLINKYVLPPLFHSYRTNRLTEGVSFSPLINWKWVIDYTVNTSCHSFVISIKSFLSLA